jgi:transcriptional regulator with XRE-family HTH domain
LNTNYSSDMDIGKRIEKRRKFLKIKQEDMAEICGVSSKSIQKIENDKANPTLKTLQKILDVLGMEIQIDIKKITA